MFINDYWKLAIKYKAYGVHLGQEDLDHADLKSIEQEGLRLGVSTHSYFEAAKIRMLFPSYVAIGGINLERVNQVQGAGPDIISIVRDITLNSDPTQRALDIMDEIKRDSYE